MKVIIKYKKSVVLVLVLLIGAGVWYWRRDSEAQPSYRPATVQRGDIVVAVQASGIVQPSNRLEIKPPIAGRIEQVLVREGDSVHRGQVMAWMSSSERAALLDAARAKGPDELKRWEELYRPTPIIAPLNGTVILRNAEPGQTFQNSDAVLVLSDRLIVQAQVDETDIAQVKPHQTASITLDAYSDRVIEGVVDQIAFEAKTVNNVTTYAVDVTPRKVPAFMRSGMTANLNFVVLTRKDVLVVPTESIGFREGKAQVLVAGKTNRDKPVARDIQTGVTDGRHTEVAQGLAEGEHVLIAQLGKNGGRTLGAGSNPFATGGARYGGGRR